MIGVEQIKKTLQDGFNALNERTDREFVIYNDVGTFKHEYRAFASNDIIRYVNGIIESMQPTIMPIKNLEIQTQSFRITFALDVAVLHKDSSGNYKEVEEIRDILEKYISQNNAIPYLQNDDSNKSFEVTPTFGGVTVGLETQMSPVGRMLPMYFDFSCVFVESGVNTNNINFVINGENMFFQEYSATRLRTAETNMVANESSQKTLIQANGISINLKMPLLNTTQSEAIESDVWGGKQNEAICVERFRVTKTNPYKAYHAYIMIYGNNSESGSLGQNIGQGVDFVEGKQSELSYSSNWGNTTFNAVTGTMSKTLNIPTGKKLMVVFWGDEKTERVDVVGEIPPTTVSHTYTAEGSYTIRYFSC